MGIHHLISINEDELRNWRGDHDELLANGAAVVLACLDPKSPGLTIHDVPTETALFNSIAPTAQSTASFTVDNGRSIAVDGAIWQSGRCCRSQKHRPGRRITERLTSCVTRFFQRGSAEQPYAQRTTRAGNAWNWPFAALPSGRSNVQFRRTATRPPGNSIKTKLSGQGKGGRA